MKRLMIAVVLISGPAITFASELETLKAGAELKALGAEALRQINVVGIPASQIVPAGLPEPVSAIRQNSEAASQDGSGAMVPEDKSRRQRFSCTRSPAKTVHFQTGASI